MNDLGNMILKSMNAVLSEKTMSLPFDRTFKSTVWGRNADGTYQISYMGQLYNVYNALGTQLSPGQSVWVKIPCGILRNMHICGIHFKKKE